MAEQTAPSGDTSQTVDAIAKGLAQIYAQQPIGSRKSMSENGNGSGQYQAIRVEVDAVKGQLHDFKDDINSRFSSLQDDIRSLGRTLADFIQTQGKSGGDNLFKILGVAGLVAGIATSVVGGFVAFAKVNLDTNIAFTNEKIAATNGTVDKLAVVVTKLAESTIPRPELENRLTFIREQQQTKADKAVVDQVVARIDGQVAYVRSDIERLKGDIVTRRENEGHWSEFQNRVNLLSDRVNDLAKSTNGTTLADQIKGLQEQITALRNMPK